MTISVSWLLPTVGLSPTNKAKAAETPRARHLYISSSRFIVLINSVTKRLGRHSAPAAQKGRARRAADPGEGMSVAEPERPPIDASARRINVWRGWTPAALRARADQVLVLVVLIAIWQALSLFLGPYWIGSPWGVLTRFVQGIAGGDLLH